MYRVKTICQKLLLNQRVHFKHLFLLLLLGSSIAAFAGLYAKQGANLSQFTAIKSLFSKKELPVYADSIRDLKATNITAAQATLSWAKPATAEKFTVTVFRKGLKLKSISTSSNSTTVTGLDAGTTYTWNVTGSANNITSATASFATMAGDDAVEGEGPVGLIIIVDGSDGIGTPTDCTKRLWVLDKDGDNVMSGSTITRQCTSPGEGYVEYINQQEGDCDDNNSSIKGPVEWVLDADGDGYYTDIPVLACENSPPAGYVRKENKAGGDCNDNNAAIKPGAIEICDGIDNDCNGIVDDVLTINQKTFYRDADNDGFGTSTTTVKACTAPPGYVENNQDCNDNSAAIKPGATEIRDNIDNDCDGIIDEGFEATALPTSVTANSAGVTDYIIPQNITSINMNVQGAKGGSFDLITTNRGIPMLTRNVSGGVGRKINVKFTVDANCEQGLKPGGKLRLIVGATPSKLTFTYEDGFTFGGSTTAQGGGGGSAILYQAPGSSVWVPLVVTGGGGGSAFTRSSSSLTTSPGLPGIAETNNTLTTGQNTLGGKSVFITTTEEIPKDRGGGGGFITTTTTFSGGGGGYKW